MPYRTLTIPFLLAAIACGGSAGSSQTAAATKRRDASAWQPATLRDAGTRVSDAGRKTSTRDGSAASGSHKPDAGKRSAADGGGGNGGSSGDSGPAGAAPKNCVGTKPLSSFVADPKLCVYTFAEGLGVARGMAFAPNGDLFVSNSNKVTVLWDANGDGYSSMSERQVFGQAQGLNHGLAFSRDNKFLYASSSTIVYRFAYIAEQRAAGSNQAQVVISGIPGSGGHTTRTLAFDSKGRLYVSVGSASNVDSAAGDIQLRSQIRRFELPATIPQGGVAYESGEVIATGMRNEVGLYIDDHDRLWGVENGRDDLHDDDFGGDIHNDNPGEEINLVDGQGAKFYGYPSCYSELKVSGGKGPGAQWSDQSVAPSLLKTDAFCADPSHVHPPAYVMPAHWAPLGVIVYRGRSLPYTGDLIITAHGSWDRMPATGRVIARAKLQGSTVTAHEVIVGQKGGDAKLSEGNWNIRPVDVREGPDEAIYVSDDQSGSILKIGYHR